MSDRTTFDVSHLPENGFGTPSTPWWGTLGFIVGEGFSLLVCAASYLYIAKNFQEWPPGGQTNPDLLIPTIGLALLLASLIPGHWLGQAARRMDPSAVTRLLVLGTAVELVLVVLRLFEFQAVHVRWDTNAYGSAVWFILGFHTLLLLTDLFETGVFAAIFASGRAETKHFTDAADVAFYWQFVVFSWIPLYLLLYWSPRIL